MNMPREIKRPTAKHDQHWNAIYAVTSRLKTMTIHVSKATMMIETANLHGHSDPKVRLCIRGLQHSLNGTQDLRSASPSHEHRHSQHRTNSRPLHLRDRAESRRSIEKVCRHTEGPVPHPLARRYRYRQWDLAFLNQLCQPLDNFPPFRIVLADGPRLVQLVHMATHLGCERPIPHVKRDQLLFGLMCADSHPG